MSDRYMGLREAARYVNVDGVPPHRALKHPTIRNWIIAGYVRSTSDGEKYHKVNVLDVIACTIAQRAGQRWSGKQLHISGIGKPAAFTDPGKIRRMHAEMLRAGFPPLLDFGPDSPDPEPDLGRRVRAKRVRGLSLPKIAKSLRVSLSTVERAAHRRGRFA